MNLKNRMKRLEHDIKPEHKQKIVAAIMPDDYSASQVSEIWHKIRENNPELQEDDLYVWIKRHGNKEYLTPELIIESAVIRDCV